MRHTRELAEGIITDIKHDVVDRTSEEMIQHITNLICYHLDDVAKTSMNIESTSLNKMDRAQRYIELEVKYGIPKTHFILRK